MGSVTSVRLRVGRVLSVSAQRPGVRELRVWVEGDEQEAAALSYDDLTGPAAPGDRVVLNTTAVALGLGTGGFHLVMACSQDTERPEAQEAPGGVRGGGAQRPEAQEAPGGVRGGGAQRSLLGRSGHVMKARYTPSQVRVLAAEEDASPHRDAVAGVEDLGGLPVVCAELHSMVPVVAAAARAVDADLRVVYVMSDGAALPLAFSRLAERMRAAGLLAGTITAGQAFGGDLEAITVHSALAAARAVLHADVAVVAQGPGGMGSGTRYGFSGVQAAEALNAAAALGGR
ncbi:MAG TPA: DUF3866 family protein, partial [Actinomycetes bacterium]|nr:DUF3866 family protein [Actinomycetes bacterium]